MARASLPAAPTSRSASVRQSRYTLPRVAEASYDYVIVGGGSAGCILAARLSASPDIKVLLLGRNPEHPRVRTPSGSVVVALRKPFGILELRAELRALLEVGDPDDAHSSID